MPEPKISKLAGSGTDDGVGGVGGPGGLPGGTSITNGGQVPGSLTGVGTGGGPERDGLVPRGCRPFCVADVTGIVAGATVGAVTGASVVDDFDVPRACRPRWVTGVGGTGGGGGVFVSQLGGGAVPVPVPPLEWECDRVPCWPVVLFKVIVLVFRPVAAGPRLAKVWTRPAETGAAQSSTATVTANVNQFRGFKFST